MNHFPWHSADTRWLRRWLRNQLVCLFAIAGYLVLARFESHRTHEMAPEASRSYSLDRSDLPLEPAVSRGDRLPPETELIYLPDRRPNPVAPHGWRRTDRGWEDVSTWRRASRPLREIVMAQEAREPGWMKAAMEMVRRMPPLAFAMLQIAAISGIIGVSRGERRERLRAVSSTH